MTLSGFEIPLSDLVSLVYIGFLVAGFLVAGVVAGVVVVGVIMHQATK